MFEIFLIAYIIFCNKVWVCQKKKKPQVYFFENTWQLH